MSDVIDHIFVKFSTRQFTIVDEEGYEDVIKYKWDEEGAEGFHETITNIKDCLLYTSPSPRDVEESRMPSSA